MYKLKIIPQAEKDLNSLQNSLFQKIKNLILFLANEPRPHGSIKLTNENGYRLRVGDYRVLYRIDDEHREIFIYRIKHRKEVYR